MSTVNANSSTSGSSSTSKTSGGNASKNDALTGLGVDDFLKLMISELQNQDPLNPMDNAQMIQQIGELRQISSSDKLTKTLDSVLLGQNLSSATSLIGKTIEGLDDASKEVTGKVDSVSVTDGVAKLHVGAATVSLANIRQVVSVGAAATAPGTDSTVGAASDESLDGG